ncbi:MAG: hypothetical protein ABI977_30580 [Acidobacteriota bacterium]
MSILKIILVILAAVIATIAVLAIVGMAINMLYYLFWLAVIFIVLVTLVKLFGGKGDATEPTGESQNRLQGAEQTLDEYKRKLEAEVKQSREKQL